MFTTNGASRGVGVGLAGVLGGAAATGALGFSAAARSEWLDLRSACRRARVELDEIESTVRFVTYEDDEIRRLASAARLKLAADKFEDVKPSLPPGQMLELKSEVLARYLATEDWDRVDIAKAMLKLLRSYERTDIELGRLDGVAEMFQAAIYAVRDRRPPRYLLLGWRK